MVKTTATTGMAYPALYWENSWRRCLPTNAQKRITGTVIINMVAITDLASGPNINLPCKKNFCQINNIKFWRKNFLQQSTKKTISSEKMHTACLYKSNSLYHSAFMTEMTSEDNNLLTYHITKNDNKSWWCTLRLCLLMLHRPVVLIRMLIISAWQIGEHNYRLLHRKSLCYV